MKIKNKTKRKKRLGMFFYVDSLSELVEGDLLNHNYPCNFQFLSWGYYQKGSGFGCMEKPASRVGEFDKALHTPNFKCYYYPELYY